MFKVLFERGTKFAEELIQADSRIHQAGCVNDFLSALLVTEWPLLDLMTLQARQTSYIDATMHQQYQFKPFQRDFARHEILLEWSHGAEDAKRAVAFGEDTHFTSTWRALTRLYAGTSRAALYKEEQCNGKFPAEAAALSIGGRLLYEDERLRHLFMRDEPREKRKVGTTLEDRTPKDMEPANICHLDETIQHEFDLGIERHKQMLDAILVEIPRKYKAEGEEKGRVGKWFFGSNEDPSEAYRGMVRSLRDMLARSISKKRIYYIIIWGRRLTDVYLARFLERMSAFGLAERLLVLCLDDFSLEKCQQEHCKGEQHYEILEEKKERRKDHPERVVASKIFPDADLEVRSERDVDQLYEENPCYKCIPGKHKTIVNKYTMASAITKLGFDAVYLDFDTVLLKNIDSYLDQYEQDDDVDVATARDFGVTCANTGVIYFKSTPATQRFLHNYLTWIWHHPYEFSQKAFSAFFGIEKAAHGSESPPGPGYETYGPAKLALMESTQHIVTQLVYGIAEGWAGSIDNIVLFHFVDGTGGVDAEKAVNKRYVNAYEVFYNNANLDLSDVTVPLHEQDENVKEFILRSRWEKKPEKLQKCVLYVSTSAP